MFASTLIEPGTYVGAYRGERITAEEGEERIEKDFGKYVYFFGHKEEHCIDAIDNNAICSFINDSPRRYANCFMKAVDEDPPRLVLQSKRTIKEGEELRYTYDEDSKLMWWRTALEFLKPSLNLGLEIKKIK